jgi:hypothetical protein
MEEVLEVLEPGLVPLDRLLTIIGGGRTKQTCYTCGSEFRLLAELDPVRWPRHSTFREVAVKTDMLGTNRLACSALCRPGVNAPWVELTMYMCRVGKACGGGRACDTCQLAMVTSHRCSGCQTKVYCGPECQEGDRVVHDKVCSLLGQEGRKKKPAVEPLPETEVAAVQAEAEAETKAIAEQAMAMGVEQEELACCIS